MRRLGVVVVTAGALLLGGCMPAQSDAAVQTVRDFQSRLAADDWTGACNLLSEETRTRLEQAAARPCATVLPAHRLPADAAVGRVEVWGRNGSVQAGGDTVFVSRFSDGWRVIAAGCQSQGKDLPYDCSVRS